MKLNDWTAQAKCKGMDTNIFFPLKGASHKIDEMVRAICYGCPVSEQCLEDALSTYHQIGYRAGLSAKQRRSMLLKQQRESRAS